MNVELSCTEVARSRAGRATLFQNAGWCYDNYPELEPLRAHTALNIADFEGPGVVTCIHVTRHILGREDFSERAASLEPKDGDDPIELPYRDILVEDQAATARGVLIETYYDGSPVPSVRSPLADFFADGCGGNARHFSTSFVEKLPESYNCYIPMPFRERIRIVLVNETDMDLYSYSFVEGERLPAWRDDLLYFHATWRRELFQLTPETVKPMITIENSGHIIGKHFSFVTSDPMFKGFYFIMEGNCEHRIDGEETPSIDYLGTEDSFGLSWGFAREMCGLYSGVNYLRAEERPYELSVYRFRRNNPIVFNRKLDIRINWRHEFTDGKRYDNSPRRVALRKHAAEGGCFLDLASTYYWYQQTIGFEHATLPSAADRANKSWCEVSS